MQKIVFCDIDGTLVHGKQLYSVKDLEAIRQIMCFPISAEKRKKGMR